MATWTYGQIEQLWIRNGGDPNKAAVAAAIAMAESGGGNDQALNNNPKTGDYSVGLWQTNYFGNLLQSRTQAYGSPSDLLASADAQAKSAVSISNNGQDWTPWTTYTSKAYLKYLDPTAKPDSSQPKADNSGGSNVPTKGASPTNLPGIGGFLQELDKALNPTGPGAWDTITSLGTAQIGPILEMVLVRAGLAVGFTLVVYFGIKQITGGGGGTNVIQITEGITRTRQAGRRASTAERAQDLRERQQAEGAPVRRYERTSTVTYRNPAAEAREGRLASKVARKTAAGKAASFVDEVL